jgi:hypothetical protein
MVERDSCYLISLYNHYEKGQLLLSGGVADQPNVYLESMTKIGDIVNASKS